MDQQSVAALIAQQYPGLLALLRRKFRDGHLAQDVLNQALVTSLEHLRAGRIADPALISGYVFQVAMNQVRNHRRKMSERVERRADVTAADTLQHATWSDPAGDVSSLAVRVRTLIESLPTARDREIVKRFYLDEDDKDKICEELGLTPLHFDKVVFRARQRMKALLQAQGLKLGDFFSVMMFCFA